MGYTGCPMFVDKFRTSVVYMKSRIPTRFGLPEETATVIGFLASDESSS